MSNTIKIKRRNTGGTGAPSTLQSGELAWNDVDNTLYVGRGDNGSGVATTRPAIAGSGSFVSLADAQTISGNKTFSGTVSLGSSASATTPASNSNDTTVATTAFVTSKTTGFGTGTVTSVAMTVPSILSVSGSPIQTSGTLALSLANQSAFQVFAGPSVGGSGTPSFRALTADDIPSINFLNIGGNLSLANNKITSLATPTASTDAATKGYVDSTTQGLDVKASCRVATTANITLSGTQTIDGISVVAGNRVLVKNQTTASQNGIYVVAAGAWSRSDDANNGTKLHGGTFTFVEEGTTNADSGWVMTTDGTVTIDTTAINWSQFSGAGQIDAGNGLTKTGNTLNVVTADSARIVVNPDSIDLANVTTTTPTGSATANFVSAVTTDAYGRVTSVTTSPIRAASVSEVGVVQLSDSTTSTSSGTAATSAAVKSAKDVADAAVGKGGATMTGKLTFRTGDTTSAPIRLPTGTAPSSPQAGDVWSAGNVLYHYSGTKTDALMYADLSNISGTIGVGAGGTGAASFTSGALLKGNGTNAIQVASAGTDFVKGGVLTVGTLLAAAATTGAASVNIPTGTAPTAPNAGDVWNTGTALQFRNNASGTKTIAFTDSAMTGNTSGTAAGLSATLVVGSGGTGATSLLGYVKGNGTNAMTAAATIPNTDITGLGTMSTQAASSVSITGGSIDGIVLDGGTF